MRELLDLVDDLLALVVALARVALGVLVREARAGRLHHGARGVVLARDEAHRLVLAAFSSSMSLAISGSAWIRFRSAMQPANSPQITPRHGSGVVYRGAMRGPVTLRITSRRGARSRRLVFRRRRVRWPVCARLRAPRIASALAPPTRPMSRRTRRCAIVAERRAGVVLGVGAGHRVRGRERLPEQRPAHRQPGLLLVEPAARRRLDDVLPDGRAHRLRLVRADGERREVRERHWKSTGFGIGFRVEVFPLVRLFPRSRTPVYGQAGVGSTELQAKGNFPSADGTQSFAGIGVHHEFRFFRMLGGHLSGGPYVEYDAIFATLGGAPLGLGRLSPRVVRRHA